MGILFRPPGEGERKVRSLSDALLPRRDKLDPGLIGGGRTLDATLPKDEVDPRRCIRLVTMSPIGTGVLVDDRRAAAAAAAERPASAFCFFAKARAAAVDAAPTVLPMG